MKIKKGYVVNYKPKGKGFISKGEVLCVGKINKSIKIKGKRGVSEISEDQIIDNEPGKKFGEWITLNPVWTEKTILSHKKKIEDKIKKEVIESGLSITNEIWVRKNSRTIGFFIKAK